MAVNILLPYGECSRAIARRSRQVSTLGLKATATWPVGKIYPTAGYGTCAERLHNRQQAMNNAGGNCLWSTQLLTITRQESSNGKVVQSLVSIEHRAAGRIRCDPAVRRFHARHALAQSWQPFPARTAVACGDPVRGRGCRRQFADRTLPARSLPDRHPDGGAGNAFAVAVVDRRVRRAAVPALERHA